MELVNKAEDNTGNTFVESLCFMIVNGNAGGTGDLFAYWDSSTPFPTISTDATASVPEPNTLVLLVPGLLLMFFYALR